MVSVLSRKLGRDLLDARGTLFAIIVVVFAGVACFVGMASVYRNLNDARVRFYRDCRMADFWVDLKKAPLPAAQRLLDVDGIADVEPRITALATLDLESEARPVNALFISRPVEARHVINDFVLVRGSRLSGSPDNEAVVTEAFARAHHINPGDTIHALLNNRRQELLVVGIGVASEFTYLIAPGGIIPDPESFGVVYINQRFAEDVLDYDGACNQIVGLLAPGADAAMGRILDEAERRLDAYGVFTTTALKDQSSHQILSDELAQLRASSVILPGVFLAIAALVLNILMSRLVEQQRVVIGTLKALGYTNHELLWHYLAFALAIGLIGSLLGVAGGFGLAQGMTVMYRQYFEFPSLQNHPVPWLYAISIVVGMGFAAIGALRSLRVILRLPPAQAMRRNPPVQGGAIALERARRLWRKLGFRWQMALRSVWRHPWRTGAGVFAATMAASLLFTTFYFMHSMDFLVRFQFDEVLTSDMDLAFDDEQNHAALLEARDLSGVEHAEPLFNVACEFVHGYRTKRAGITGVSPNALLTVPRWRDGTPAPIPGSGLLMSRALANMLGVETGDELTVVPIKGLREPHRVRVARIIDGFVGMATYADIGWLSHLVGEASGVSGVQLKIARDPALRRALLGEIRQLPNVQTVNDTRQMRRKLQTILLDAMRYSVVTLIALAGVMSFGSILTASLIAISERRREIATLIAMGHDKARVGGIFLRESLVINVVGALLGLPLGWWFSVWLVKYNSREAYRLPEVTSPQSAALTLVLAIAFTLTAHMIVQRSVNRLDWLEALNAKE